MRENHIFPFLWMRGEEEAVLRKEMEKIKEAGINAVCLEARPHPEYAGEKWWHDVDIIIDEAKKRDMQIWILDDAHFPTGMANNGMERHPEQVRRWLFNNSVDVTGPVPAAQVDVDLMMTKQFTWMDIGKPESKPILDETELFSVIAVKMHGDDVVSGEAIDVTSQVKDGYLTMDVPEGTWRIFVNFVTTGIGPKPEYINYIEKDSVRVLIDEVYEKHYARYPDLFGTVIAGFFSDEPGFYNTDTYDENCFLGLRMTLPWGKELYQLLKEKYDGDLEKDIDYLFANDAEGRHRALRVAYMDVVSYLYGKNFTSQLGDWCRAHNVRYIGHIVEDNCGYMRLGAGVGHYFRAMEGQDMAGIDNIGYQLMPGNDVAMRHTGFQDIKPDFYHYMLAKLGASSAAIDPKKKGRLMCENFGAYGWRLGVRDMKWLVDYLVGQGVNYFVPHAFSMAEYPDVDCPPHFYARGNNPQYPYFCDLMRYTDRLCNLFSEGKSIAAAAVLFEAEADWAGCTMRGSTVGKQLIRNQIDFLFIPADVFGDGIYPCCVQDNKLVVNDHAMDVLLVPECEYIPLAAANFIKDHPELPVIYINKYPAGISEMPSDEAQIVAAAVKDRECVRLEDLAAVLRDRGFCDALKVETPDCNLRQYHYQKDGKDYYLLANASVSETVNVFFRKPEGKEFTCYEAYEQKAVDCGGDNGTLHIVLLPYHSVILTDADVAVKEKEAAGTIKETVELKDFSLELRPVGKEAQLMEGFVLQPISGIDRDFSGEMVYRTTFECKSDVKKAWFSAEHVYECMQLVVNGTELPKVIVPPYTADITCALKEGENTIEIHVASTALRDANTKPGFFGKERSIIEPTGMFGGVRIDFCE